MVAGVKVLHGIGNEAEGHRMPDKKEFYFDRVEVNCSKKNFSHSGAAFRKILREIRNGDFGVVLMPMEKKHLLTILYLYVLKHIYKFRLASYNHHYQDKRHRGGILHPLCSKTVVRLVTRLYDKIVYYTERGMDISIQEGMVHKSKAFYANNTIDIEQIFSLAGQQKNQLGNNILFIGRIVPSKRLDLLIEYFKEIQKVIEDCKLLIIGDGPESAKYQEMSKHIANVHWLGAIVDEAEICRYAQMSKIVFVPGHSGLSINHSFAYGKPYVTLERETHPPEIDYIINGKNGLILPMDDKEENVKKILRLLTDNTCYDEMSAAALETAQQLTLENWIKSMKSALNI